MLSWLYVYTNVATAEFSMGPIWTRIASSAGQYRKLDEVGPIDNRPSTDKLHHFLQKK